MVGTTSGLSEMRCRHTLGGRHHQFLTAALASPVDSVVFNHERYTRPCVSHGSYDAGKNGGLVVHDLCVRAAAFLRSIGRGDIRQSTGRDFDYDPSLNLASSSPLGGESELSDDSQMMDLSEDITITASTLITSDDPSEYDDDGFFEDEDVQQEMAALEADLLEPPSTEAGTVSASDMPSSQDSVEQWSARRSSTKMRAATLGYLWNFADDWRQLRIEFRRLRSDRNAQVLHLCGCGLCFLEQPGDRRVVGCAERSHLTLGLAGTNDHHKTYHMTLGLTQPSDYVGLVRAIHVGTDGAGLF